MKRIPLTYTDGATGVGLPGMFMFGAGIPITQLGIKCKASARAKPKAIGAPRNKPVAIVGKR